ncbi:MAG TPA: DUF2400 family protein, partial [Prolixibacteraceae bacterium]|nr:DUF2400 family protein [Prolixibacteraceae bacterium]
MNISELKEFLDEKAAHYNHPRFVETDPIQIPHRFSQKENIEIAGLLTATIAWGNRQSIIKNASRLMTLLENQPFQFITEASERELKMVS